MYSFWILFLDRKRSKIVAKWKLNISTILSSLGFFADNTLEQHLMPFKQQFMIDT